jgi:hypothetical protein
MNSKKMFLSLIPWVLFSVIINRHGADAAAIAALAAAALSLVLLVKDAQKTGVKIIDLTGVVTFGVLAGIGFSGGHSVSNWIADYGRGSVALVLAVIMLGSAITVPFTEQYARESVPRRLWSSPRFVAINRQLTLMWACVFTAMIPSHIIAGAVDTRRANTIFNWVIPIILIVWAAKRTATVSDGQQAEVAR